MPSRELGSLEFCVSCASRQSRGAVLHATDSRVSIEVVSMPFFSFLLSGFCAELSTPCLFIITI